MARRDNQGTQIAMIVFIITTLLFMILTYVGYSSWAAARGEADQASSKASDADSQRNSAIRAASELQTSIGLDSSMSGDAAQAEAKKVAESLGQGLPDENKNFIGIIAARDARVADLTQQLFSANAQVQQLTDKVTTLAKTNEEALANAQAAEATAMQDYQKAVASHEQQSAERDKFNAQLDSEKNKAKAESAKARNDAAKQIAAANAERDAAVSRAEKRQEELLLIKKDTPDKYDGRIIGVVAATRSVIIDKGREDGVRPKTTFTVYDAEDSNVRTAKKKATIEVTKVINAHRSEARITDADYTQPIVGDDYIYSPIWSPGTRLGIALVGKMDIDLDGRDDREYVRNLIELNGGKIDAEDIGGKMVGAIDVDTRYLVMGEAESTKKEDSVVKEEMMDQARLYTVERMSVGELLDLMSPPGRARSVKFNSRVPVPGDFPPQKKNGIGRNTGGSSMGTVFRQRTPTPRRLSAGPIR